MNLLQKCLTVVLEVGIFLIVSSNSIGSIGGSISKNVVIRINKPNYIVPQPNPTTTLTPPTTTQQVTTIPKTIPGSVIQTGIGCGTKYLKPRDILRIESNNFDQVTPYPPNGACTWKFISQECTISAECPCFDVSPSFECIEDYLKILDLPFYHQKFCGSTKPQGQYRASTEIFAMKFRSNKRNAGRGFVCYVQCTAPGEPDQKIPDPMTQVCPKFFT